MSRSIFDLPHLIAWLDRQEPERRYGLWWKRSCLLGRYFADHGIAPSGPWWDAWSYGGVRLGRNHPLVRVARRGPKTYGMALERARLLQARHLVQVCRQVDAALAAAVAEAGRTSASAQRGRTRDALPSLAAPRPRFAHGRRTR
jgi:hypothetical protein